VRCANRNKQYFWYAPQTGVTTSEDEYGNECSAYPTYGNPVKVSGNISAARGDVVSRQFGDDDEYDRVIVVEDRNTAIDEYSVLWIDETPSVDTNGALKMNEDGTYETPWNYIVRKVGRGLPTFGNAIISVSKVTVR